MKIRIGFVSNSSSASFIIKDISKLSKQQIDMVLHHRDFLRIKKYVNNLNKISGYKYEEKWDCWPEPIIEGDTIRNSTTMDNTNMYDYLVYIVEIDPTNVEYYCDD